MPCGGIVPAWPKDGQECIDFRCFVCLEEVKEKALFIIEWDAYLHYKCLGKFLVMPEGQIILEHEHTIHAEVV